jgi:hypothetical protein
MKEQAKFHVQFYAKEGRSKSKKMYLVVGHRRRRHHHRFGSWRS